MRCTGTTSDIQQIFNIWQLLLFLSKSWGWSAPLDGLMNMSSLATGGGVQRGSEVGEDGGELVQGTAERQAVQLLQSRSKRSLNVCVLKT